MAISEKQQSTAEAIVSKNLLNGEKVIGWRAASVFSREIAIATITGDGVDAFFEVAVIFGGFTIDATCVSGGDVQSYVSAETDKWVASLNKPDALRKLRTVRIWRNR